jgi:hypothetical protein
MVEAAALADAQRAIRQPESNVYLLPIDDHY